MATTFDIEIGVVKCAVLSLVDKQNVVSLFYEREKSKKCERNSFNNQNEVEKQSSFARRLTSVVFFSIDSQPDETSQRFSQIMSPSLTKYSSANVNLTSMESNCSLQVNHNQT